MDQQRKNFDVFAAYFIGYEIFCVAKHFLPMTAATLPFILSLLFWNTISSRLI